MKASCRCWAAPVRRTHTKHTATARSRCLPAHSFRSDDPLPTKKTAIVCGAAPARAEPSARPRPRAQMLCDAPQRRPPIPYPVCLHMAEVVSGRNGLWSGCSFIRGSLFVSVNMAPRSGDRCQPGIRAAPHLLPFRTFISQVRCVTFNGAQRVPSARGSIINNRPPR